MSTAIQRRGRPGLATLIEKFPLILFLALLVWLSVQSPYFLSWQKYQPDAGPERSAGNPLFRPGLRYRRGRR